MTYIVFVSLNANEIENDIPGKGGGGQSVGVVAPEGGGWGGGQSVGEVAPEAEGASPGCVFRTFPRRSFFAQLAYTGSRVFAG